MESDKTVIKLKVKAQSSGTKRRRKKKNPKAEEDEVDLSRSITEILGSEEREEKLLYICTASPCLDCYKLTTTDLSKGLFYKPVTDFSESFPPHMVGVSEFGIAHLGSDLYFVGGFKLPDQVLNDVSVFDLATKLWHKSPPMKKQRSCPVIITYKDTIYAFGSTDFGSTDISTAPAEFAECYNITTRHWSYLSPPPKEMFAKRPFIASHAFSEEKGLVCFWVSSVGIYSYNFKSKSWIPFQIPISEPGHLILHPRHGRRWSTIAVLLDSFIIWHYFGSIFAYRFSDHAVLTLYQFKKQYIRFGDPADFMGTPQSSYLVYTGNGKLCLLHRVRHIDGAYCIRCHTFDIRYSPTSVDAVIQLSLKYQGCKAHKTYDCDIYSVFTMINRVVCDDRITIEGSRDKESTITS